MEKNYQQNEEKREPGRLRRVGGAVVDALFAPSELLISPKLDGKRVEKVPGEPTPAERLGGDVFIFNAGHASKPVDKEKIRVVAEAIRNLRKNSLRDPKI